MSSGTVVQFEAKRVGDAETEKTLRAFANDCSGPPTASAADAITEVTSAKASRQQKAVPIFEQAAQSQPMLATAAAQQAGKQALVEIVVNVQELPVSTAKGQDIHRMLTGVS